MRWVRLTEEQWRVLRGHLERHVQSVTEARSASNHDLISNGLGTLRAALTAINDAQKEQL